MWRAQKTFSSQIIGLCETLDRAGGIRKDEAGG